jgi:hypothetical protein
MQLCHGFWLEHGTVIDTTLNIALTGPGLWIHRTKEITPAENGGIEHGRLITTWRFSGESSDSTAVEEIIELTEKIFKSRIISQEGPGRPEGHVLPSEIFTVTRVTTKK